MISRKVGLHVINGTSLALGRPKAIKLVDPSVQYVADVRALVDAECFIDIRFHEKNQTLDNPTARAFDWYDRHITAMLAMAVVGGPIGFEGYNEIADDSAAAYAEFETVRLHLLHGAGLHAVVGNWSVGTPNESIWPSYASMLAAMDDSDMVGLHEYWADTADLENRWHVARFTLPEVAPYLANKCLLITEAGRDIVERQGQAGWQRSCNAETYIGDLRRAGEIYDQYDQVIGVTVFQTGSSDSKWQPFDVAAVWPTVVAEYDYTEDTPMAGTKDNPIQEPLMEIDGRCMAVAEFEAYIQGLTWDTPRTSLWLHHTWRPTVETWAGASTIAAMRRTYGTYLWQDSAGLWHAGWDKGPHLFVAPDGIWLFYDIAKDGYHAGGAYNVGSIGIEMVGDYDQVRPSGAVLEYTLAVLGILFKALNLDPIGLRFHRDNPAAGKTCPGTAVTKEWIIPLVQQWMAEHDVAQFEAALGEYIQDYVIPQNPAAAFYAYGRARGWEPISGEVDYQGCRAQDWYSPEDQTQHIIWCRIGDWGNLRHFDRAN